MASITRFKDGNRIIQFIAADGKRKTVRLGPVSQRVAEFVKVRLESLISTSITGCSLDPEASRWISTLDAVMLNRLSAVGLIPKSQVETLGSFLEKYIKTRTDTKDSTHKCFNSVKRNLFDFFDKDKPLRDINHGDADEFRLYLLQKGLADNTVRRRCGIARQFFRAAIRKNLIKQNPFSDMKVAVLPNPSRMYFVSMDAAKRILEACPDAQWRLIFALCRFGGLRCPSEITALKWSDIDWEKNRITVHCIKTEHHVGKDTRQIPIFAEIMPHLQEVFDQAQDGAQKVITRYNGRANLRNVFMSILAKAGLNIWPKMFQNLRSTRETELAGQYPLHVVCYWMGNSQPVAAKHYLQITDDHFKSAVGENMQQIVTTS
jgi:integrase